MPLNPVSSGDPHVPAHNSERALLNALELEIDGKISLPGGALTGDLLRWDGTQWATTETRFFEGTGRPEGNFAAPIGSRYIDKTAAQGAVEWVKRSGEGSIGWLCIAGDTGIRNIASLIEKRTSGVVNQAYVSRIGHVVDMHIDITMPNNTASPYILFAALPGFGPGYNRFGALQDNSEAANTNGTLIDVDGGAYIYNPVAGKRDRYSGTWLTWDAWPTTLPGAAA